ncbi:MAG: WD40 repeat domain-containing protein, partial [Bacteroidia bacterium]
MRRDCILIIPFLLFSVIISAQNKSELVLPIGHMSYVESIKFTPDSNYILTSSFDGKVKLWHIITGKLIRTFNHADYSIDKVVIEPNHNFLLTIGGGPRSKNTNVKIWNIKTGSLINTIGEYTREACFTPNGDKLVVANSKHVISVFNYKNDSFEFSSYLIENQKEIETYGVISTMDFNLDGTKLFVGSGSNLFKPTNYEIFDFYSKKSLKKIKGNSIDFYPLKQKFFVSHDSGVTVYDIKSLQKINVLPSKKPKVELVKLDLIKNELLVVSNINQYTSQNLALEKWDLNNYKLINESSISNPHDSSVINSIDIDKSNNKILISTWWGNTNLYEISTGDLIKEFSGFIARFLPDNERFISVNKNKNVFIREVNTGNNIYNLKGAVLEVNCIDLDNNSINVGSGFSDNYVNIWNIRTGNIQKEIKGYINNVYGIKFIPDKNRIITSEHSELCEFCDQIGFLKLWDLNSDSIVAVQNQIADDIYFSNNGEELVSIYSDFLYTDLKSVEIYDKNSLNLSSSFHLPYDIEFNFDTSSAKADVISYDKTKQRVFLAPNLHAEYKLGDSLFIVYDSIGNVLLTVVNRNGPIRALYSNPDFNSHYCLSNNGILNEWNMDFSAVLNVWDVSSYIKVETRKPFIKFYQFSNYIVTIENQYKTIIWDAHTGKQLYTRLQLENNDWLAYDEHYRFDGSPGGIDQLYLVCGLEVIDLNQVKDSLYVPGLVTQIMSGAKEVMMNDRPAPKLEDLQICELTPVVEPIDQDKTNRIRYRIIPRKGGLGNVELYINNNLTYTYKASDLKKEPNTKNYILEVNTDTLQQYLIGDKGTKNPI